MDELLQRRELAAFLRSRRESLDPTSVGFTTHTVRRTPGLRREEVAGLAGVSLTWYTWLEQARKISVSRRVIDSIGRTLRLSPAELDHMYTLAGFLVPSVTASSTSLEPDSGLREVISALDPMPGSVINLWWDLLAFNQSFDQLLGGVSSLPPEEHNLLRIAFTSVRQADLLTDWTNVAATLVGQLRTHRARHPQDNRGVEVVEEMCSLSADFASMWGAQDVQAFQSPTIDWQHPVAGSLRFRIVKLTATGENEQVVVYVPADHRTRSSLSLLQG